MIFNERLNLIFFFNITSITYDGNKFTTPGALIVLSMRQYIRLHYTRNTTCTKIKLYSLIHTQSNAFFFKKWFRFQVCVSADDHIERKRILTLLGLIQYHIFIRVCSVNNF